MSQDHNNPAFKKLLQKLQEESWQLELIISGFAIFGLFTAFEPINLAFQEANNNSESQKAIVLMLAQISCAILIFNLLLHVLLRGLWIGALGLRYVSGDIDYEKLNYSPKFNNYLKKKVGSFDKYIATLENYCSIIFAVSFLLIFYVLATFVVILTIASIANYILDNESIPESLRNWIGIPLMIFFVIGMLLTFIDFLTQGFLKKKKWLSKIYFPIYWVFGFITLSFLYKPLVYNFLDNKFGKRLSLLLVPIYLGILMLSSFTYHKSNYFNVNSWEWRNSSIYLDKNNYKDELTEKGKFISSAMIDSKVIDKPYLNLFLVYSDNTEDAIFNSNPDLEPEEDQRGIRSNISITGTSDRWQSSDSLKRVYIKQLNKIHEVRIDTTTFKAEFLPSVSATKEFGFETYIKLDSLSEGKHILTIWRERIRKGDTTQRRIASIPFWYFKD